MHVSKQPIADFVRRARQARDLACEVVGRRSHTRFDRYIKLVEHLASLTFPAELPFRDDPTKQTALYEGATQLQELVDAAPTIRHMGARAAREKVALILKGRDLPPTDSSGDTARNILFEFTCATALRKAGFEVAVPEKGSDIVARHPSGVRFQVECKRPAHGGTLGARLRDADVRLRERCTSGELGMILIAIDRVAGLAGKKLRSPSDRTFLAWLNQLLKMHGEAIERAAGGEGLSFFPAIPVTGVALTSAVFLDAQGILFPFSQTGLFFTGEESDPRVDELKRSLGRTVPIGRDLPSSFGAVGNLPSP